MKEVSIIGVDLVKQIFQLHGATGESGLDRAQGLSMAMFELGLPPPHFLRSRGGSGAPLCASDVSTGATLGPYGARRWRQPS